MKKIYLEIRNDAIGSQLIDKWFAYHQSQSPEYRPKFSISTDQNGADLKILFDYLFQNTSKDDLSRFDILLCCNGGEPVAVASPKIKNFLENDNCYMICNSLVGKKDNTFDRLIWYPHNIMTCRDYWTRYFYPHPYENIENSKITRSPTLYYINGKNVAWRHYFISLMKDEIPEINLRAVINPELAKIRDSQWESFEDQQFREELNSLYPNRPDYHANENYYSKSPKIGINDKFGSVPLGYFILPLYYENSCIIFPEGSWQNHDLCVTEKILKCFYSGSLPFPVGGANINYLYNQIGFYTAWNLLPTDLQKFDGEENHRQRYAQSIKAIRWLYDNNGIFQSKYFQQLTESNFKNFLICSAEYQSIKKFDNLINKYLEI